LQNVTEQNRPYIEKLIAAMESGGLEMTPLPCICGEENDVQVADKDRFEIPITVKLCQECGLIRTDPYFTEEALGIFYKDYYRKIDIMYNEEEWTEHERCDVETTVGNVKNVVDVPKGATIIEVGCGLGAGVKRLAEMGYNAIGIDVNVEDARRLYPDCTFREEWGEDQVDGVILTQVFEHFRDPVDAARRLRRLIKDDGWVQIAVPGLQSVFTTYRGSFQQYLIVSHPWYYVLGSLVVTLMRGGLSYVMGNEYGWSLWEKCEPRKTEWPGAATRAQQLINLAERYAYCVDTCYRTYVDRNAKILANTFKDKIHEGVLGEE